MTELCTESSHINPLLGLGLLLSLPSMSFSLFFLCLCHSVCFSLGFAFIFYFFCLLLFFFFYPSLSVCLWPLLSYLSNHSSSQTSHCLALLSLQVIDTCVTGCHFVLRAPHWHQQVANVTLAWRRVGTSERRWRWNCRGGLSCVCLCHRRVGRDWSPGKWERLSQWVFGWNREPFPGQRGSITRLPALTTPMSTVEAQEVKCV